MTFINKILSLNVKSRTDPCVHKAIRGIHEEHTTFFQTLFFWIYSINDTEGFLVEIGKMKHFTQFHNGFPSQY